MTDRAVIDAAVGEADEPFWRALDRGAVELPRCAGCGRWVWPVQPICPACFRPEPCWTDVVPEGTVYSWTRTWYPFVPERAAHLPYVVVVVEIPGAGDVRVLGVLRGDDTGLVIGARVVGHIAAPSEQSLGLPSLQWELV